MLFSAARIEERENGLIWFFEILTVKNELNDNYKRNNIMPILLISLSLISAVICYLVSKHRGSSTLYWITAGLLVGPLAIPFVFFSKPEVNEKNK